MWCISSSLTTVKLRKKSRLYCVWFPSRATGIPWRVWKTSAYYHSLVRVVMCTVAFLVEKSFIQACCVSSERTQCCGISLFHSNIWCPRVSRDNKQPCGSNDHHCYYCIGITQNTPRHYQTPFAFSTLWQLFPALPPPPNIPTALYEKSQDRVAHYPFLSMRNSPALSPSPRLFDSPSHLIEQTSRLWPGFFF